MEGKGVDIDVHGALRFNKLNNKMARVADYSKSYEHDLERMYCLRDYYWLTKGNKDG
jgi:hypothetical protein